MEFISYWQRTKKYPCLKWEGIENLINAKDKYEYNTLISSHTNKYDIPVLDCTLQYKIKQFPVFIMRNNLKLDIGKVSLPLWLSQWLYVNHTRGGCNC